MQTKKLIFLKVFRLFLFEGTFTSFFKDKKSKRSHKTVCLMIEGSESIPLTRASGSGSRRPKNIWNRQIRILILICNTASRPRYFQYRILMFCLPIFTFIYLWAIYIFPGSVCIQIGRPILGIYKPLKDLWMYIQKSDFLYRCGMYGLGHFISGRIEPWDGM
jgi:hypothetical protein